jgi:hypothetical protein
MNVEVLIHVRHDGSEHEGNKYKAEPPYANAPNVELEGNQSCPRCNDKPLRVAGFKGVEVAEANGCRYVACGCYTCGKHVGTLKVEVSSLFGEEEDRAVLFGRQRVY